MPVTYVGYSGLGPPSSFVASNAQWQQLNGALAGLSNNIVFNLVGEGFPQAHPNTAAIGTFILDDGVWVDFCGEPFYYYVNGGVWMPTEQGSQLLQAILQSIGAEVPISGYFEPDSGIFACTPSYPFPRGVVTREDFTAAQGTTALAQYRSQCYRLFEPVNVYGAFGVKSPLSNGWYFYAYTTQSGGGISASDYAGMITKALGSQPATGCSPACTGGQICVNGVCQCPAGTSWNGSACVTPGGQTCQTGTYWNGTQCVPIIPPGGGGSGGIPGSGGGFLSSLTTMEKVGGSVAILALVASGFLIFGGGE